MKFQVIILIADEDLPRERFEELLGFVPSEKRERILRFRSYRDAQNCLLGDVLARQEISRVTGLKNEELEFSVSDCGKPFLKNVDDIHYNISHSGHYIALALDNEPVGIDIERLRPIEDRYEKIAKRFFTPDEAEYIQGNVPRFMEIWTKKEARIKWEGKGLSKPLPSFDVLDGNDRERLFYHKAFENNEAVCYVCSAKAEPPSVRVTEELKMEEWNSVVPTLRKMEK